MALTRSPTQLPQQTHEEAIGQSEEAKGAQADSDGVATSEGTNSFDREDRPTSGSVDRSAKFDNNQQCHKNRKPAKTVSFALPIAQIREISPPPARRSARLEERALSSIKAASSTNTKSTVKPSTRRSKARDRHGILRSRGSTVFRDGNANANGTMQVSGLGMGMRLRSGRQMPKSDRTPSYCN
jgi:hypothetical protein